MSSKPLLAALVAVGVTGLLFVGVGVLIRQRQHAPLTFQLTDVETGQPFSEASLVGQPTALFFGFTTCPDVCPTALVTAGRWLDALGAEAAGLRFVFVTVDPERDTPEMMARYLTAFDPRISGLSGTRAQTDRIIAAYNIVATKVPSGTSYRYDHTSLILLIDRQGHMVDAVDFHDPEDKALGKLRALIKR